MDTLTHTVLGACLGEAIAGKQLGKKAMLVGAFANNLPDIDVLTTIWTSPAKELLVHRGITHSILCAVLLTPLLAYTFFKLFRQNMPFTRWLLLIGSGLALHLLTDACTTYGTGWFEPFSHHRVTFNTLFILDPFFMLPMLVCAILLLIVKRSSYPRRTRIAFTGLGLSLLYLLITFSIKLNVNGVIEKDLAAKHIEHEAFMATPTPLNNLLWYSAVKSGDGFYVGYYSILDKAPTVTWEYFKKNDSLLGVLKNSEEVQYLQRFSKNYYAIHKQDSLVIFSDVRFGQLGGWYVPQAPFVFNFELQLKRGNRLSLQQGRFRSFNKKDIGVLIERVKGK